MEDIVTGTTPEYQQLRRELRKAIAFLDEMIAVYRPTIYQEVYLTSEEVREMFGLSLRCLQNYRDNRQIPFTTLGGKILYPQSKIHELLEKHYMKALR